MGIEVKKYSGYYYRLNKKTNMLDRPIYGYVTTKFIPEKAYYYNTEFVCAHNEKKTFWVSGQPGVVKYGSVDCLWLEELDEGKAYKLFYNFYKNLYEKKINTMLAHLNDIKINAKCLANMEVE